MAKTKTEFLQDITAAYREANQPWPTTARHIAAWAIQEGMWRPHPRSVIEQCASELTAAMREEYFTDAQGRRVRKKHAIRDIKELPSGKHEQICLWVDIDDATHEQMVMAFQNRRRQALGDCKQLKTDVDSYNDNNGAGEYIEMCFDFTDDLMEMEQPEVYPGLNA